MVMFSNGLANILESGQTQEENDNLILNGDGAAVVRLDQHQGVILQV
jgi:hypothetical protein